LSTVLGKVANDFFLPQMVFALKFGKI